MPLSKRRLGLASIATLAIAAGPAHAAKQPYTATPGPERADARFVVTYDGLGTYRTVFHGEPHNPDGHKDDVNDARDSSRQSWGIRFRRGLAIPQCGAPGGFGDDPCAAVTGLEGARGPTTVTGRVNHRHVDGIYPELDRKVKCRLRKSTGPRTRLQASLEVRYLPESDSFGVRAHDPVATALSLFPTQCPRQGDSIDRILDFYATPGFSFADEYGPERWFTSREVVIPAAVFHGSSKIVIHLRDTRAGTPPADCAVHDPDFERCSTGGSWRGALTLKAR